jgi:hypothetical protein
MFLGHFGVALAAKRAAPSASLGMLVLGAQFADLIWPLLLLAGIEQVRIVAGVNPLLNLEFADYPYSHSLLTQLVLGGALGAAYRLAGGESRAAWIVALLVPSHWLLDWFVHVPDLTLYPGDSSRYGLGVWRSLPLSVLCELIAYAAGVAIYVRTTRARDGIGRWSFAAFIGFLLIAYAAALLGGAPPSVHVLAWSALSIWLLPVWTWWFDRHRVARA